MGQREQPLAALQIFSAHRTAYGGVVQLQCIGNLPQAQWMEMGFSIAEKIRLLFCNDLCAAQKR